MEESQGEAALTRSWIYTGYVAALLYAATGIVAALPPYYAIQWSVWGGPRAASYYPSLIGSILLLTAAVMAGTRHKRAPWVACGGVVALWSFYAPIAIGEIGIKLSDRHLTVLALRWEPGQQPLVVHYAPAARTTASFGLNDSDVRDLRGAGITGEVTLMAASTFGHGRDVSVLLLMFRLPTGAIQLLEPKEVVLSTRRAARHGVNTPKMPALSTEQSGLDALRKCQEQS